MDIKYSFDMSRLPSLIGRMYRRYIGKFQKGYFNRKFLHGNANINLRDMTKYCFEPYKMTVGEAMSIGRFNRISSCSLLESEYGIMSEKYIAGLTIVIDSKHTIVASYFAVRSSALGYRHVYYRRWKGEGLEEIL